MSNASPRQWYRQLWPWLVMIPPAGAVVGGIATVIIAFTHAEYDVRANRTEFMGVPHEGVRRREAPAIRSHLDD